MTRKRAVLSSLGRVSTSLKYRITSASTRDALALSSLLPLIRKSTVVSRESAIFFSTAAGGVKGENSWIFSFN